MVIVLLCNVYYTGGIYSILLCKPDIWNLTSRPKRIKALVRDNKQIELIVLVYTERSITKFVDKNQEEEELKIDYISVSFSWLNG